MAVLRKFIQAGAIIALMTGAVYAQVAPLPDNRSDTAPTKEEEAKKTAHEAYKSSLKQIPGPDKKSDDPWGDVRPTSPTAAKNKQQ